MESARTPDRPLRHRNNRRPLPAALAALGTLAALVVVPAHLGAQEDPPPPPDRPMTLFGAAEASPVAPASPAVAAPRAPDQETGFLGVAIENLDAEEASELGLDDVRGVRVQEVMDESPAQEAGLREGDVVLEWGGEPVMSAVQLTRLVRETPPGRTVTVGYLREGQRGEVRVTVSERSGTASWVQAREMSEEERQELRERMTEAREEARRAREEAMAQSREAREKWREEAEQARRRAIVELREAHPGEGSSAVYVSGLMGPRIGVRLISLTDQLAGYFGLDDRTGALVVSVEDDSPAREAGLQAGDVILSVDGSEVDSPGDVSRMVRDAEGQQLEIQVLRRGDRRTVTVGVPEDEGPTALEMRLRELEPRLRGELAPRLRGELMPRLRGELEEIGLRIRGLAPLLRGTLRPGEIII